MVKRVERRHAARLTIPSQFGDPALGDHQVRLVNLSPEGACIEHLRSLAHAVLCFVDLPAALGGTRLQGEMVWSQVVGRRPDASGRTHLVYRTGIRFACLTPQQQAALAAALKRLAAGPAAPPAARATGKAQDPNPMGS